MITLGSHQLKGLPDPVEVYGLLGLRSSRPKLAPASSWRGLIGSNPAGTSGNAIRHSDHHRRAWAAASVVVRAAHRGRPAGTVP